MKRFTAYIMILLSTLALVSCEAVEDRLDIGGFISAEQLDITATPVIVDGKATNKVILNNSSPVLSSWDFGTGKPKRKQIPFLWLLKEKMKSFLPVETRMVQKLLKP